MLEIISSSLDIQSFDLFIIIQGEGLKSDDRANHACDPPWLIKWSKYVTVKKSLAYCNPCCQWYCLQKLRMRFFKKKKKKMQNTSPLSLCGKITGPITENSNPNIRKELMLKMIFTYLKRIFICPPTVTVAIPYCNYLCQRLLDLN